MTLKITDKRGQNKVNEAPKVKNQEILERLETEEIEMEAPSQISKRKREEIARSMSEKGFLFAPMDVLKEKSRPNSRRRYVVAGFDMGPGGKMPKYILFRANGDGTGSHEVRQHKRDVELAMEVEVAKPVKPEEEGSPIKH